MSAKQDPPLPNESAAAFRRCYIPPVDSEQTTYLTRSADSIVRPYEASEGELVAIPSQAGRAREPTFISFGDNGTTSSFTDMGQLMQVCSYLDAGHSSMFSAHPPQVPEPFLQKSREDALQSLCQFSDGFGLDIQSPLSDDGWSGEANFEIQRLFLRNRWPVILVTCDRWDLELRCIVHNGIVIQQEILRNKTDEPLQFVCFFSSKSLIRDLDHVDGGYPFNEDEDDSSDASGIGTANPQTIHPDKVDGYAESVGPGGYGLVRVHRLSHDKRSEMSLEQPWYDNERNDQSSHPTELRHGSEAEAVGLVMGVTFDGELQAWGRFFDDDELVPGRKRRDIKVGAHQTIDITAGYKLVLLDSQNLDWRKVALSSDDLDCDAILARTISSAIFGQEFDFATRRNVEHILSVCSIPVTPTFKFDTTSIPHAMGQLWNVQPLALTCGDIAGHQVSISASYFAFKLLIAVSRALENNAPLRERIMRTCRAHLLWVFKQIQTDKVQFICETWTDGKKNYPTDATKRYSPTCTPLQILKAVEFCDICTREDRLVVIALLEGGTKHSLMKWLEDLDARNTRDRYAWRHSSTTQICTFRLDDHAWIWSSLKALNIISEGKGGESRGRKDGPELSSKTPKEKADTNLKKRYELEKVRREMISRFTTVNDHFKQRMLAFTRSAREDRFVLHSRDTALFYADFLNLDIEVWKNTLNAQRDQKENQDVETDNPLRYVLVVLLDRLKYSINRTETAASNAIAILEGSRLANGLYPGRLDESTKTEKSFDYAYSKEFYYHVAFEIPYFLWAYKWGSFSKPLITSSVTHHLRVVASDSPQDPFQGKHQRRLSTAAGFDSTSPEVMEAVEINTQGGTASKLITLTTGKIASNMFINSQNVVEVAEEWLYDIPPIFDYEPVASKRPWRKIVQEIESIGVGPCLERALAEVSERMSRLAEDTGSTMDTSVSDSPSNVYSPPSEVPLPNIWQGNTVLDFAKKSIHGKSADVSKSAEPYPGRADFWSPLSRKRKTDSSKKRLVWMNAATSDVAVMCLFSAHEEEKENISLFFDLHSSFETGFSDVAVRVRNIWETEFHISFLQIATKAEIEAPKQSGAILKIEKENLPEMEGRSLVRASVGFRFFGDFMDRFWTCHVLLFIPHERKEPSPYNDVVHPENNNFNRGQRKVLELCLFCYIIAEANRSLDEILNEVMKRKLNLESEHLNRSRSLDRDFLSQATLDLGAHGQVLEVLEQDLGRILDTVADWENRERDRQQERPRWTKSDERKHGFEVNKFSVLSRRRVRELRGHMATIRTHKNSVNSIQDRIRYEQDRIRSEQESLRSEQERRGNENIRYFTYATIFFLPLSFAVSVYSMQAPPTHDLIVDMSKVAVIGIVITISALAAIQYAVTHKFRKNDELASRYRDKIKQKLTHSSSATPDTIADSPTTIRTPTRLTRVRIADFRKRLLSKSNGELEEKDLESAS